MLTTKTVKGSVAIEIQNCARPGNGRPLGVGAKYAWVLMHKTCNTALPQKSSIFGPETEIGLF